MRSLTTRLWAAWMDRLITFLILVFLTLFAIPSDAQLLRPELTILQTPYPTVSSEIVDTDTSFAVKTVTRVNDNFTNTKTVFGVTHRGTLILSFDAFIHYGHWTVGPPLGFIRASIGSYPVLIPIHQDYGH